MYIDTELTASIYSNGDKKKYFSKKSKLNSNQYLRKQIKRTQSKQKRQDFDNKLFNIMEYSILNNEVDIIKQCIYNNIINEKEDIIFEDYDITNLDYGIIPENTNNNDIYNLTDDERNIFKQFRICTCCNAYAVSVVLKRFYKGCKYGEGCYCCWSHYDLD